jgi:hypothetical protein
MLTLGGLGLLLTLDLPAQAPVTPAGTPASAPAPVASAQTPADALARGQMDGKAAAEGVGTGAWIAGGVASGVVLGLIGTGIIYLGAGASSVELPPERRVAMSAAGESPVYQQAFQQEYERSVRSRRKNSALGGGLIGSLIAVVLLLNATGSQ